MRHARKNGTTRMTGAKMARDLRAFYPKLARVVDARHDVLIKINEADIMLGDPHRPYACATARCLMRAEPGSIPVVSERYTYLIDTETNVATRYANTPKLREQIREYDKTASFRPGAYTIGPPNPAHAIGAVHPKSKTVRGPQRPGKRERRIVRGWHDLMAAAKAMRAKVAV